jgi:flagellar hook-basal body complex protein FliE
MNVGGIDQNRILAMMEQLKAAAQKPAGAAPEQAVPSAKVEFGQALKNSLQAVSDQQAEASKLGQAFTMGDNSVSLSDVMISMQKASINFQATVQVRNKLVSAYHEIMNMQV